MKQITSKAQSIKDGNAGFFEANFNSIFLKSGNSNKHYKANGGYAEKGWYLIEFLEKLQVPRETA